MAETGKQGCPFCGGAARSGLMGGEGCGYGYVECLNQGCGDGHFAGVHADDEAVAIKVWNTRASLSSELARCRNALEKAREAGVILQDAAFHHRDCHTRTSGFCNCGLDDAKKGFGKALATIDAALNPIGEEGAREP